MAMLRSWSGRYTQDHLYGHKAGVRCVKLLPSQGLLATGSLDRTVRLWDLAAGMPLCASRPHGGTVRCLALDTTLLASGASDSLVRLWSTAPDPALGAPLFDLSAPPHVLAGHSGPVSSLSLAGGAGELLVSGSWDCTVRTWRRGGGEAGAGWECAGLLRYDDWVYCAVVRGPQLLVSSGADVLVQDLATGQAIRKFCALHEGPVTCLEGAHNGRVMFSAGGDGLVLAHDLRMKQASRVLWHHNAGVGGLALEDPWLASAGADGTVMLINTEARQQPSARALSSQCRQLQCQLSGPASCLDLAEQWLVAGGEAPVVRLWDFTGAAQAEQRAADARASRASRTAQPHRPRHAQPHHHQRPDAAPLAPAAPAVPAWPHQQAAPAAARQATSSRVGGATGAGPAGAGGATARQAHGAPVSGQPTFRYMDLSKGDGSGRPGHRAKHGRGRFANSAPQPPPPPPASSYTSNRSPHAGQASSTAGHTAAVAALAAVQHGIVGAPAAGLQGAAAQQLPNARMWQAKVHTRNVPGSGAQVHRRLPE